MKIQLFGAKIDKFKKSFEQEATLRNLSDRTRTSYWWHINDYGRFIGKDPEQTGLEELRGYFQSMLTEGNHKPGSVKMGYYACVSFSRMFTIDQNKINFEI